MRVSKNFKKIEMPAQKQKPPTKSPPYNFGAASSRDRFIYGCARPGHTHPEVRTKCENVMTSIYETKRSQTPD